MSRYIKVEDIMRHINTDNRGNCDYFIVDRIEELCNSDKTIDLADHDKQIRDEIIEELQKNTNITLRALATELMKNQKNYSEDSCHYFSKGIQAFVIHIENFIAEQMVE